MRIHKALIFCVPFFYTHYTRYRDRKEIIRFIFNCFLPIIVFLTLQEYSLPNLILGFLLTYDLYEIGYIENDCETIKQEQNPTMRVSIKDLAFYEKYKFLLYSIKVIISLVLGAYLLIGFNVNYQLILFPFLLIPTYFIYNRIRCRWNLVLHAFLMFIRYYAPVLIATGSFSFTDSIAFLFIYPIRVMIELSVKGKFGGYKNKLVKQYLLHDYSEFQQFRLKYYIIGTILTWIFFLLQKLSLSVLMLYAYFLLFTLISMNTVGKHKINNKLL